MLPSRLFFDDSFFKGDESIKSDIYEKDGRLVVEMEAPGYTLLKKKKRMKKIRNIFIVKEKVIVKYLEVSI